MKLIDSLSFAYSYLMRLRVSLYKHGVFQTKRLPCAVVSIGNLVMGGTGKTPFTVYVAESLKQAGYKVAVLSRGYKGKSEKSGGIVSDGETILMQPDQAGDEPYLMATKLKGVPVLVGGNRYKSGLKAISHFNPDVVILDDGFQHIQLYRDLNICLCDSQNPFGNGFVFPSGALREPIDHLWRADAVVLTRGTDNIGHSINLIKGYVRGKPVFASSHEPSGIVDMRSRQTHDTTILKNKKVVGFSGIANNNSFISSLLSLGACVACFIPFPDHHRYSEKDIARIIQAAERICPDYIVTTEKDYMRLRHISLSPLNLPALVLSITISFREDLLPFETFLKNRIKAALMRT
ncbi:MAG: tetraacyldisaccharide 4'-kinase [Pseudomonadota bacterium]